MFPNVAAVLRQSADVQAIVADRVWRNVAPEEFPKRSPYVTWFVVVGTPLLNLSEPPPVDNQQVQIDMWHTSQAGLEALVQAVRAAVETTWNVNAIVVDERDRETKLYRRALQVTAWGR